MPAYLKARARLLWLGVALGLLGPLPAAVAADASKTEAADSAAEAATPAAAPTTAPGEAPPTDLDSLRACLGENLPAQSLVQNVRLIASDSAGGRELKARVYGMKLDSETAVMIDVRAPSDMSGSRYLVIAGPERDAVVVAFRGTLSLHDVLTDLVCEPVPFQGGHAHAGMLAAARAFVEKGAAGATGAADHPAATERVAVSASA